MRYGKHRPLALLKKCLMAHYFKNPPSEGRPSQGRAIQRKSTGSKSFHDMSYSSRPRGVNTWGIRRANMYEIRPLANTRSLDSPLTRRRRAAAATSAVVVGPNKIMDGSFTNSVHRSRNGGESHQLNPHKVARLFALTVSWGGNQKTTTAGLHGQGFPLTGAAAAATAAAAPASARCIGVPGTGLLVGLAGRQRQAESKCCH